MKQVDRFQLFIDDNNSGNVRAPSDFVSGQVVLSLCQDMLIHSIHLLVSDEIGRTTVGSVFTKNFDSFSNDRGVVIKDYHHREQLLGASDKYYKKGEYTFPFNFKLKGVLEKNRAHSFSATLKDNQDRNILADIYHGSFSEQDFAATEDWLIVRQHRLTSHNIVGKKKTLSMKVTITSIRGSKIVFNMGCINNSPTDYGPISMQLLLIDRTDGKTVTSTPVQMDTWPNKGPSVPSKSFVEWCALSLDVPCINKSGVDLMINLKPKCGKSVDIPLPKLSHWHKSPRR